MSGGGSLTRYRYEAQTTTGENTMKPEPNIAGGPFKSGSAMLKGKRAVVFGAGGSIGAAVAKEFAAEGAEVFLAGRSKANVEGVVKQIMADGGCAETGVGE